MGDAHTSYRNKYAREPSGLGRCVADRIIMVIADVLDGRVAAGTKLVLDCDVHPHILVCRVCKPGSIGCRSEYCGAADADAKMRSEQLP